jgi:hypothetical protein
MAKENNRPNSRGKMTVMMFQLEGDDHTLQQGLNTISEAINKMVPLRTVPSIAPPPVKHSNGTPSPQQLLPLDDQLLNEEEKQLQENDTSRAPRDIREYRTPNFLHDFNLNPEGQIAWKEFAAEKNPQTLDAKYLTASSWITKHAGLETFTREHVFTCFRTVKWDELKDFTQPMRRMKSASSYFTNPKRGDWKLTTHGLEEAERLGAVE